jgi:Ca2+-binding RTX toxin-like protein
MAVRGLPSSQLLGYLPDQSVGGTGTYEGGNCMRIRFLTLSSLAGSLILAAGGLAPAGAAEIPEDCAVPPDIDLSTYNVIIGTDASETIIGTNGPDAICALLGDDRIVALGGDDLILGDTSTFFGNVNAEGGDDTIFAGAGDDEVLPGPGDDTVDGGPGDDFLALAQGNDSAMGGLGADTVIGGIGNDSVFLGPGDDFGAGGPGDDLVDGGAGDDFLAGELPPDSPPPFPFPPSTADRCVGSAGFDVAVDCDVLVGVEG